MPYTCDSCRKACKRLYSSQDKESWLCDKCFESEPQDFVKKIKESERELVKIKARDLDDYQHLNSTADVLKETKHIKIKG